MILLVFFLFLRWEGGCVRAAFPHLGLTKHTPWRPVPPLSPSVSHTPPLPSLLPRLSLFVCTVWTIVLVNNYYSTPPPHKVGKYNSIFLCALGNLYNSILNLNETIKKTHVEKQLKRDIHEEEHQQYWWHRKKQEICVSLFVFCLVSVVFAGFSGGYSKSVTAEQGFGCVFTKRHETPTKAFRFLLLQVCRYDVVQCDVVMMRPHACGLVPDLVQLWSWSWYSSVQSGSVCMYVLETSEGPVVSGWVHLRWLQELKFKEKKIHN